MKYRKKPVEIEANQWHKNGDHPDDKTRWIEALGDKIQTEGKIVRYFLVPDVDTMETPCKQCGGDMLDHGWIDTLEGGHIVCPGDWIIKGVKGEFYPCKPDIFAMTYEKV